MPLKAGKGTVNLGPHCVVSANKLTMEMDPYRHGVRAAGPWIDRDTVPRVAQKALPGHKGSRVYEIVWSGLTLCEVNIPTGTPEDEHRRTTEAAVDLVRLRWGQP